MTIEIPELVAFLKQVQLFRGLEDARLTAIAGKLTERLCDPDEVVINQGKEADSLFMIYSGTVRLPPEADQTPDQPAVLEPGNYFGEEAFSPRAFYRTTVTARERTLLLILSREDFYLLPAIPIFERISFLKRIHLFNGLNEEQFDAVAGELEEQSFPAGLEIITEGMAGDCIFLIYSGKVRVTKVGQEKPLATFVAGDYVGEESMLEAHHHRTATVTAVEETLTLVLRRDQFHTLLKQVPTLRGNFAVTANSHRLARKLSFKWLQPDEVIYFLARKHPILLVRMLAIPVLLGLLAAIGMIAAYWYSPQWSQLAVNGLWYTGMLFGVVAAGLGAWNIVDWGNDYYIVTDRRVVWLEKVIGIYDSRQESPLSAIQRVNVETELTGRVLDYGDLVVRTIVGSTLTLKNINHPYQAAALIEEHWKRSRENSSKMEEEEMRAALRVRLVDGQRRPAQIKGIVAKPSEEKKNPYKGQRNIVNLFRMRFEQLSTVTYRKHVFVMFAQTWKAGFIILILLGILGYEVFRPSFSFASLLNVKSGLLSLLWVLMFGAALLWWIYEYVDWSNDIFQVTPDQILDIDKTPLGQVTSDIAALDNILSIEYKRIGILELLFNYGTVYITVGGGKQMAFENVYNPSAVQEDIERRRLERANKKEEERTKNDRERLADWFAAYYHHEQEFRLEDENPGEAANGKLPAGGEIPEDEVK